MVQALGQSRFGHQDWPQCVIWSSEDGNTWESGPATGVLWNMAHWLRQYKLPSLVYPYEMAFEEDQVEEYVWSKTLIVGLEEECIQPWWRTARHEQRLVHFDRVFWSNPRVCTPRQICVDEWRRGHKQQYYRKYRSSYVQSPSWEWQLRPKKLIWSLDPMGLLAQKCCEVCKTLRDSKPG